MTPQPAILIDPAGVRSSQVSPTTESGSVAQLLRRRGGKGV